MFRDSSTPSFQPNNVMVARTLHVIIAMVSVARIPTMTLVVAMTSTINARRRPTRIPWMAFLIKILKK
jgi:hypothetical protein